MHRAPTSLVQKYLLHGVALGKEIGGMGLKNSFREEVQTWADISLDCPERGHARKFKKGHLHFFLKSCFGDFPSEYTTSNANHQFWPGEGGILGR
jgi:hypothetical protein